MNDLIKLAERVEAGGAIDGTTLYAIIKTLQPSMSFENAEVVCRRAVEGSLDAASALHDTVLLGWEWGIDWFSEESEHQDRIAWVRKCKSTIQDSVLIEVMARTTPAAAWVAAILRAKASMSPSDMPEKQDG